MITMPFISVVGCVNLDKYQASFPEEEEVLSVFRNLEVAWNKRDKVGILSQYAEDARIMSGREKNWYDKRSYAQTLKDFSKEKNLIQFGKPKKVEINGNKAEVHINMVLLYQTTLRCKFKLVRDIKRGNRWLITERWYTY